MIPQKDLSVLQFLNFVGQMTRDNGLISPAHFHPLLKSYKDTKPVLTIWAQMGISETVINFFSFMRMIFVSKPSSDSLFVVSYFSTLFPLHFSHSVARYIYTDLTTFSPFLCNWKFTNWVLFEPRKMWTQIKDLIWVFIACNLNIKSIRQHNLIHFLYV